MQLTETERAFRKSVITRIESVIHELWPNAHVKPFGSTVSGFGLPDSDIDLMILGVSNPSIQLLATKIVARNISEPNSIRLRENFTVPLIEFIDRESKIDIDLRFNVPPSMEFIKELKIKYPTLPKLLLILKHYLKQLKLNDTSSGGISSFSILLLLVNFLQMRDRNMINNSNMGILLLDFLELYGRKFDYENYGITIENGGELLERKYLPCGMVGGQLPLFCIKHPTSNPLSNTGDHTYRGLEVKQALDDAFLALSKAISSAECSTNDCAGNSILCHIIYIPDDLIAYRNWIQNTQSTTN